MLPYLIYCPQNIILGPADLLGRTIISFTPQNKMFYDSSVVIFQNPTVSKINNYSNPVNKILDAELKNCDQKRKKIGHKIMKNNQNRKNRPHSRQNEVRNIFSNIARLIINFISLQSKSRIYLIELLQKNNIKTLETEISQFYRMSGIAKSKIKTVYLSKQTFYSFLGLSINQVDSKLVQQPFLSFQENQTYQKFRSLAYFYLHSLLPKQIIHSKKINPKLKESHLKIGKDLLKSLRMMLIQ